MALPEHLMAVLGVETVGAWQTLAGVLPRDLYLSGVTALAAHLGHRTSRDLDFFYHQHSVDLRVLEERLNRPVRSRSAHVRRAR